MADQNNKKEEQVNLLDQLGELTSLGAKLFKRELKQGQERLQEGLQNLIDQMKEELDEEQPSKPADDDKH